MRQSRPERRGHSLRLRPAAIAAALGLIADAAGSDRAMPNVTIRGVNAAQVSAELVGRCIRNGASVVNNSTAQVVCAKPFPATLGAFAFRALATPSNATNPLMFARYNVADTAAGTIVGADFFYEFETAYGQKNTQPIDAPKILKEAQANLDSLKATLEPPGTESSPGPGSSSSATTNAADHWSAARDIATGAGCGSAFVQTVKDQGREVFRAECPAGDSLEIECWLGVCRRL